MKTLLIALFFPAVVLAAGCQVDGISDSPQKYDCTINVDKKAEPLHLVCVNGTYQLQWMGKVTDVSVAYHEEVETGSSPLVFRADQLTLKTVDETASLVSNGKELKGLCH